MALGEESIMSAMATALLIFLVAFILGFICGFTTYSIMLSKAVKKGKVIVKDKVSNE